MSPGIDNSFAGNAFLRQWTSNWRPYALLVLIVLLVHGATIFFGYTNYDDDYIVLDNYAFHSDLGNVVKTFQMPYFDHYYRPLLEISLIIDAHISGTAPWGYHLTNLLLHAIMTCLMFLVLIRFGYPRLLSLTGAIGFSVFPLVAETVAWIPGRNDSIAAVFVLASFISFKEFVEHSRPRDVALHILFFLCAVWSKEIALAMPVVCALYLLLFSNRQLFSKRMVLLAGGWCGILGLWYVMRQAALAQSTVQHNIFFLGSIIEKAAAVPELFGKIFLPFHLSAYATFSTFSTVLGIVTITVFIAILYRIKGANSKILFFGAIWFLIFLIPSLTVGSTRFDYLENRVYLSLAGVVLMVTELLSTANNSKQLLQRISIVLVVYIAALVNYEYRFHDALRLWKHAAESSPTSAVAHFKLGEMYEEDDAMIDSAIVSYQRAVLFDTKKTEYYNNLGSVLAKRGRYDEAEKALLAAAALDPTNEYAFYNLGSLRFLHGDYETAEIYWKKAVELKKDFADPYEKLLTLYIQQGQFPKAADCVRQLQRLGKQVDPNILTELDSFLK